MSTLEKHYKERNPLETVQLITNFFINKGYELKLTSLQESEIGTWTCHVEIFKGNIKIQHAHGKGATKEYCLASGHAELYERFCNKALHVSNYTFMKKFVEESRLINGYAFSPNEKIITYDEIMQAPVLNNFYQTVFNNNDNQIMALFNTITNDEYIGIDYININDSNDVQYYDPRILFRVINTIGLSAGNTLKEALNQAISEIFEAEVSEYFFTHENISYIEINPSSLSEDKQQLINNVIKAGFQIKILDLSYIFNTPVVASLLINPYQMNCQFNFGAFPVFDIAVERVLTELYQGIYSYLDVNMNMQIPAKEDCNIGNYGSSITGLNKVPIGFFELLTIKDTCNDKVFISQNCSNEDIYNHYITLSNNRNVNIYYKDNSLSNEIFAVSVVIPEILFKNDLAHRFNEANSQIKNDIIIALMRQKLQMEQLQNFNINNIDSLYERMRVITQEYQQFSNDKNIGSLSGRMIGSEVFVPTNPITESIILPWAISQLDNYNESKLINFNNTIYYQHIKEIMTIQRYLNTGLYSNQEIVDMFKIYGKTISLELIENCFNDKYLFLYCFVKPYYEYYHSNEYKEIIHSYMKIN